MPSYYIDSPDLFKNLVQLECAGIYFDFHNEFECANLLFEKEIFSLMLRNSVTGLNVSLIFNEVTFSKFDFFNQLPFDSSITLESLYRGRYEIHGNLYEYDDKKRSYYYLEFYEGFKMEFFCMSLQLEVG